MSSSRLLSCIDADVLRLASNFYARILLLWLKLHVHRNRKRIKFWSCTYDPTSMHIWYMRFLRCRSRNSSDFNQELGWKECHKTSKNHALTSLILPEGLISNKCALNGARNFLHSSDELKSRTSFSKWKIKCHFRVETKRVQFCDSLLDKYWLKCAS